MIKSISLFGVLAIAAVLPASAQHLTFESDAIQRGFYDRPYLRYEAEPGLCDTYQGVFLSPPEVYSQQPLQAEASRRSAITLANTGDFVEWTADAEGDGMTLRFSLPDSSDGKGLTGKLALYTGNEKLTDITISSAHAWQYTVIAYTQEKYPDNTPSDRKFARMRFDETNVLLPRPIAAGQKFRLVKEDGNDIPYTIDFLELEKVPAPVAFEDIRGDKVMFDGSESLASVINRSSGKTVYIPAGVYNVPRRMTITASDVKVVGAGMWHTTLYFNASSDNRGTYAQRGIEANGDRLLFEGFSMDTANDKRYFNNDPAMQVGKGFMGSLGNGSTIRNVRVDHFECGAWIADYSGKASSNLTVEYCRFRNNYADGINLCSGTCDAVVRHCSFRNNGDDDMAIWSTGHTGARNRFEYNTGENNWRASSCAIYGGNSNSVSHLYIADGLEEGLHVNGEFQGTGFEGTTSVSEVTIERCGDKGGTSGQHGGFWGAACTALHIRGGWHSEVKNVQISDVLIRDSGYRAVGISSNSSKPVTGLSLKNIHIDGVADNEWGVYVDPSATGNGTYQDITAVNCTEPIIGNGSSRFTFTELPGAGIRDVEDTDDAGIKLSVCGKILSITCKKPDSSVNIYRPDATIVTHTRTDACGNAQIELPTKGLIIVSVQGLSPKTLIL